jgi:hypothetical protein
VDNGRDGGIGVSTVNVERELHHLIARLRQSHPELHEGEIRDIVAAASRELEGARLRQFVPLLVERSARAACRERSTRAAGNAVARAETAHLVEGRQPDPVNTSDRVAEFTVEHGARPRRGVRSRVSPRVRGSRIDARSRVSSVVRARRASR